jgi:hypothetical protein
MQVKGSIDVSDTTAGDTSVKAAILVAGYPAVGSHSGYPLIGITCMSGPNLSAISERAKPLLAARVNGTVFGATASLTGRRIT